MIRIILDECLPVKLKYRLQEFGSEYQVSTVTEQGWTGIKNGKLLEKAQNEFDVLIEDLLKFFESISEIMIKAGEGMF